MSRDYHAICKRVGREGNRQQRVQVVVDALWEGLKNTGVSWVGFYLPQGKDCLVLGPCRDKPA